MPGHGAAWMLWQIQSGQRLGDAARDRGIGEVLPDTVRLIAVVEVGEILDPLNEGPAVQAGVQRDWVVLVSDIQPMAHSRWELPRSRQAVLDRVDTEWG